MQSTANKSAHQQLMCAKRASTTFNLHNSQRTTENFTRTKESRLICYKTLATLTRRLSILLWNNRTLGRSVSNKNSIKNLMNANCVCVCDSDRKKHFASVFVQQTKTLMLTKVSNASKQSAKKAHWAKQAKIKQNNTEKNNGSAPASVNTNRFRINRTFSLYRIAESGATHSHKPTTDETLANQN